MGLLCLVTGPEWGQSDGWLVASMAGMQAEDEGRLALAETLFRDAM
jgi:hypothetical protein